MAVPTWGLSAKSQEDPEKIEEAIARMIGEHVGDSVAHAGAGESLAVHRADAVVDHPAGSIKADKWTMSEFEFSTQFENIDSFIKSGNILNQFPGMQIVPNDLNTWHYVKIDLESLGVLFDNERESFMQFSVVVDTYNGGDSVCCFGWNPTPALPWGMSFQTSGALASFQLAQEYPTEDGVMLEWEDYESFTNYVIRLHNVPDEGVVKFYANNVLIGTLAWPTGANSDPAYLLFAIRAKFSLGAVLNLFNLFFGWKVA